MSLRISTVARSSEHLDVFNTGDDGRIYTNLWNNETGWISREIGGTFPPNAPVSAVARKPEHLDLFITGNDGRVYTSWWEDGKDWSGIYDHWTPIGGFFPAGAPVSAVARKAEHLDLFITGNDGRVYTSWWGDGRDWSGVNDNWRPIGGFFPAGAPIGVVARSPEKLDLFITGNDGRVYTSWWSVGSDWSGVNDNWRPIGGFFPVGAPISVVARSPEKLDLFVTGNDGRVYTSWWSSGSDWSSINNNWRAIGGFFPAGAPVNVVARKPEQIDLFITGNDGRVYTSWWGDGKDWSGLNNNWRSIGGFFPVGAPVSVVARQPEKLDLFVIGNDRRVYSSWWSAGSDWSGLDDNWKSIYVPRKRGNLEDDLELIPVDPLQDALGELQEAVLPNIFRGLL